MKAKDLFKRLQIKAYVSRHVREVKDFLSKGETDCNELLTRLGISSPEALEITRKWLDSTLWRVITHSYPIADTGDYDGHYELTNGVISLLTKSEEVGDLESLVKALNESDVIFYLDDSKDRELHSLREQVRVMQFMIDKGLGWKDMVNDSDSEYLPSLKGSPHTCPVCSGNGLVPNGFYRQTSGNYLTCSTTPESCRSCNGTGVLWG